MQKKLWYHRCSITCIWCSWNTVNKNSLLYCILFYHHLQYTSARDIDCVWNVMAHMQKPDFVFWRNGPVHLNQQWRQFIQLLAAELVRISGTNAGYTMCHGSVRVLATHTICQFLFQFPFCASPCAITFQLHSTTTNCSGQTVVLYWGLAVSCGQKKSSHLLFYTL
jgi:hypothetical protein